MKIIGHFEKQQDNFVGELKLAFMKAHVTFRPRQQEKETSPAFDIYVGNYQFGSAWWKKAKETDREYLSVKLDDPAFSSLIYAKLFTARDGHYALMWDRAV